MHKVAVVILNYNGKDFFERFLPSFLANSGESELIIADNASTDDSIAFLRSTFSQIKLIELSKNYGFAGGYNQALSEIEAEYYAIVNSDIEVTEGWLNPLVDYLESNPEYASVQPKIKSFQHRESFEYAGAAGGFVDAFGYPYCRGRIFDTIEEDKGHYDLSIDVDWTSGACMLVRSESFDEAGGFDASFFAHMEEIDLCWRLRSTNWKLACVPKSIVYHVGGGTLNKSSPHKTYLNFRNGLSLLVKNLPLKELLWKLPCRLVLDGLAGAKLAFEESPSHTIAVIKAHFHFYSRFASNWRKRRITSSPRGSFMIWRYYMKGEKKYSDINQ